MNNSSCINTLKVSATAMVFFCHSWITCYNTFDFNAHGWQRLLIAPAWGGVWIFLVIGGYLAAYGFYGGKYNLTAGGILSYYKNRIVKILVPTWVFISLEFMLIYQDRMITWTDVFKFLTCTFNGDSVPVPGIGATWYVFIVMWLYFLTPIFIFLFEKLRRQIVVSDFKLCLTALFVVCFLGGLYRVASFFFLDWYNWTYANVLGCMDLFVAGLITYRMNSCLPNLSMVVVKRLRLCLILMFCVLIGACSDFGSLIQPFGNALYKYVWPSAYLSLSCALLFLYAYKTEEKRSTFLKKLEISINVISPYTFAYYLWHSSILMYVVALVNISNGDTRFIVTIIMGILVTSYISFLMTKMNNGIIKTLLRL